MKLLLSLQILYFLWIKNNSDANNNKYKEKFVIDIALWLGQNLIQDELGIKCPLKYLQVYRWPPLFSYFLFIWSLLTVKLQIIPYTCLFPF